MCCKWNVSSRNKFYLPLNVVHWLNTSGPGQKGTTFNGSNDRRLQLLTHGYNGATKTGLYLQAYNLNYVNCWWIWLVRFRLRQSGFNALKQLVDDVCRCLRLTPISIWHEPNRVLYRCQRADKFISEFNPFPKISANSTFARRCQQIWDFHDKRKRQCLEFAMTGVWVIDGLKHPPLSEYM